MKINSLILCCLLFSGLNAQGIPIGQWRDHLPYSAAVAVADAGERIYCATRSSLFYIDRRDNSINRLTKINGLSDIGIKTIDYHTNTGTLVIAYENSNIDLIVNNRIINISDIKRKNIPGNKSVNRITFHQNYAFMSCGFGVVELDLMRHEIRNTMHIGQGGEHIEVFNTTFHDNYIYAATEKGVFSASLDAPNLANFEYWQLDTTLSQPLSKYKDIISIGNKVILLKDGLLNEDTLFFHNGTQWAYFDTLNIGARVRNMRRAHNSLIISFGYYVKTYDADLTNIRGVYNYESTFAEPMDAIIDEYNVIWVADKRLGLVMYEWEQKNMALYPNGPGSSNVFKMTVEDGHLWVAAGLRDESTWNNMWNQDGLFSFIDGEWQTLSKSTIPALDTIHDIVAIAVDPSDKKRVYAGTWRRGLLEFYEGQLVETYTDVNSTLSSSQQIYWVGIGGLAFDNQGNLWVSNSGVTNVLSVKTKAGAWHTFNFASLVNDNAIGDVVIDNYGQKWVVIGRGHGLLVFNDNNTLTNTGDDNAKKLTTAVGNGNLPSAFITAIAKDRSGEIWVGTDQGIAVFYSPGNVFTQNNFDAQRILVTYGGYNQYLLESEVVTAIAVDGANRKWVGTSSSGVFLLSPDGTEQILHFNENNSPLFSNNIKSIAIDHQSGEVYFGTSKGVISYRGTATAGSEDFSDIYAYPNPVMPNYNGLIAIKGLVTDVDVRITDIAGNLVYSTLAEGGQAVWNGRNLNGDKVSSGVYMVFCSNADGAQTAVTKILFIR